MSEAGDMGEPPVSRLRGDLVQRQQSKEAKGSPSERFHLATTVNTVGDEDGPPFSASYQLDNTGNLKGSLTPRNGEMVSVLSVADGLGGGASELHNGYGSTPRTGAYIAAREVQSIIPELIASDTGFLSASTADIKSRLEEALSQRFRTMSERYPPTHGESRLKSDLINPLATTFSTAILHETPEGTKVKVFWRGDSPVVIATPTETYATETGTTGDAAMGREGSVNLSNQSLQAAEFTFPADTIVVFAASDGWFKRPGTDGIQRGVQDLIQALGEAVGSSDVQPRIKAKYVVGLVEPDDTTLALITNRNSPSELHLIPPISIKPITPLSI
ncbi:hypothetical protein A3B46_03225 [Candidatus Roizmanbacteria bacterium RIFCSPLOWO2_01_FULL_39_19]|nr:MAG: hypothetical protein A3B46_03225 [Candidatus Roizmanbacteria bacterium RIFCSPLOWO2_01_FULL_39_19]